MTSDLTGVSSELISDVTSELSRCISVMTDVTLTYIWCVSFTSSDVTSIMSPDVISYVTSDVSQMSLTCNWRSYVASSDVTSITSPDVISCVTSDVSLTYSIASSDVAFVVAAHHVSPVDVAAIAEAAPGPMAPRPRLGATERWSTRSRVSGHCCPILVLRVEGVGLRYWSSG